MSKFKYLLGLTLLMSLVLIPVTSQAVSMQDLLNQIAKLTAELNFYRRGSITPVVPACTFVHDLSLGDGEEGDGLSKEVSALQKVLIKGGYLNIKNPTGWFGKMTQVAVKKWQGANIPSVPATGAIGENDRNFLCGSITPVEPPVVGKAPWINTVYHINESLMYRIEGERLENSKVYFDGSSVDTAHVSSRMINFWPPNNIGNGTYPVYVKNSYGKSNTVYLTIGNNSGITINSVSGPNSLNVGQTGTWKVSATAPAGTNLTYSVDWGERISYPAVATAVKSAISQTSTFTHSYSQAGTYTIKFKVSAPNTSCPPCPVGMFCATCVAVDNSAQTSLTVVVGGDNNADISSSRILNSNGFINGRKQIDEHSYAYISDVILADIDNDGFKEGLATYTSCGASCGKSIWAFKLLGGRVLFVELSDSMVAGAAQNINSVSSSDGLVIVVETDHTRGKRTLKYKVTLAGSVLNAEKISQVINIPPEQIVI
ncbi:MAG: hypothetical protein UV64_C0012G0020 [Parcubacteria group bacterium GW2011_GWC1_43_11b]|nr:MAG: hypothetical protein UV50_C0006G0020 [Parcubacteria group bacterium GW2011_GWB1_42_9]KKS89093.1 MAG: hypothetical protein UV64_C0012G0020 [Parcubacteria group bacterium GW2011_GWC1_43_11b]